jgi:hypothetical protein
MRAFLQILVLFAVVVVAACGGNKQPATPVETLKAYTIALKSKDTTMMKLLLSEGTLKIHQDEAKAKGVTLDEIVSQQSLFPADQRVFSYRNEKIEGDKASVEVENSFGGWDKVILVKEGGAWKIDRKSSTDQMINDIEEQNRKMDEIFDQERIDTNSNTSPSPSATPSTEGEPLPSPSTMPTASPEAGDNKAAGQSPPPAIN